MTLSNQTVSRAPPLPGVGGSSATLPWLVRFCHPAVIDSYREHPDHVLFADKLFRPLSGERISIDFRIVETVFSAHNRYDIAGG